MPSLLCWQRPQQSGGGLLFFVLRWGHSSLCPVRQRTLFSCLKRSETVPKQGLPSTHGSAAIHSDTDHNYLLHRPSPRGFFSYLYSAVMAAILVGSPGVCGCFAFFLPICRDRLSLKLYFLCFLRGTQSIPGSEPFSGCMTRMDCKPGHFSPLLKPSGNLSS